MSESATASQDWIADLCGQFSNATGWPLRYEQSNQDAADADTIMPDDSDPCWSANVSDGVEQVGRLWLDLPGDAQRDRAYLPVCELADLVANLVNQLSEANAALASRTNEVSTLVDIGLSAPHGNDVLVSLDQLLRAAVQLTGYRSAAFFLLNPDTTQLYLRAVRRMDRQDVPDPNRSLSERPPDLEALERGKAFLRRESPFAAEWLPNDVATGLCVPVRSETSPLGTLWMFDRRRRPFDLRECDVLRSVAAQMAATLERVVLRQESATEHRLKRDLKCASVVKPLDLISAPPDAGFDAAGRCTSCHELGGDLCDLIPIAPGRTAIAVGDACGNSIPAAMVMSAVRGAIRSLSFRAVNQPLTETIVKHANRALCGITNAQQFMSLVYGVLDSASRTFAYTNAGHPLPIWVHDGEVVPLESHGVLLGVLPDAQYSRGTIELHPGDTLVFYSDGISEAMSLGKRLFRSEGIVAAIESHATESPEEIMEAIWRGAELHADGDHEPDDRTLLVVRIN